MRRKLAALAATVAVTIGVGVGTAVADIPDTYIVTVASAQQAGATVATYTDAGKNCTSGRYELKAKQYRFGVTCIRSLWYMDVARNGASDLTNVRPGTEVRIPLGGATVRLKGR